MDGRLRGAGRAEHCQRRLDLALRCSDLVELAGERADRWRAVQEIKNDKSYRQIYAETGVSVTTVARIARCISHGTGGYNLMYNKVKRSVE